MKTASKYTSDFFRNHIVLAVIALAIAPSAFGVSLWIKSSNRERGLYADKRAFGVGDILTISVNEASSLNASQNTSRSRDSKIENAVTQFLFANSKLGTHGGELPKTQIEAKNSSKGGGDLTNSQNLQAQVSVVVIDVLPNGVLVLEGARLISLGGETYYAVLKGLVRTEDIGFGFRQGLRYRNTVSSQYVADAQIEYVSKGSLSDTQKQSWYQKLSSIVNPF
ncbi:MAG: flagellar biosynthesis protein FlgH [Opitutae bacterium]|jgi:flagellar L-ring protein precursor FlgH|nr:flagellar biosynthesis protein FlgH [Opitutae bacterium]|tara:strand:- start:349 stop:1017 length:669 start_codon:yes stop_codon:yes gene_type:complete